MKLEYLNFLKEEIKLEVLGTPGASYVHHDLKCLMCGNEFNATPKSKVAKFKKSNLPGCPKCTTKTDSVKRLEAMGYELLEDFVNVGVPILIKKTNCCGRPWKARPNNILSGNSVCKPCNDEKKSQHMTGINKNRIYG